MADSKKPNLRIVADNGSPVEDRLEALEKTVETEGTQNTKDMFEQIAEDALLEGAIVLGITTDGYPVLAAANIDIGTSLLLMERMKAKMMQSMDEHDEGPTGVLN